MRRATPLVAAIALALPAAAVASCVVRHEPILEENGDIMSPSSGFDGGRLDAPMHPEGSCAITIDSPPLMAGSHVPVGTDVQWDSNPPSSGPHFPIWAAFQEYQTPVPRGYYVHDLEHGAVVLLYNCPTPCPDIVLALRAASDAIPNDPICTAANDGVRVRTVITPDPLLDVPVAASAWGWTYKALCADRPTLEAFAIEHYAQAPENFCGNGTTQF